MISKEGGEMKTYRTIRDLIVAVCRVWREGLETQDLVANFLKIREEEFLKELLSRDNLPVI